MTTGCGGATVMVRMVPGGESPALLLASISRKIGFVVAGTPYSRPTLYEPRLTLLKERPVLATGSFVNHGPGGNPAVLTRKRAGELAAGMSKENGTPNVALTAPALVITGAALGAMTKTT